MREILFKAKRIDNGEWVEGLLWKKKYNSNKIFISCFPDEDDNEEAFVVDSKTICQYTGLTAKNGNKIWENDVVEGLYLFGMKINAVVVFKDGAFGLKWHRGSVEEFSAFTSICNVSYEVIGNIFDNAELLKAGEA